MLKLVRVLRGRRKAGFWKMPTWRAQLGRRGALPAPRDFARWRGWLELGLAREPVRVGLSCEQIGRCHEEGQGKRHATQGRQGVARAGVHARTEAKDASALVRVQVFLDDFAISTA